MVAVMWDPKICRVDLKSYSWVPHHWNDHSFTEHIFYNLLYSYVDHHLLIISFTLWIPSFVLHV